MRNKLFIIIILFLIISVSLYVFIFENNNNFSITENRKLFKTLSLTTRTWKNNSFQDSIENTLSDHFPYRNSIVKVHNIVNTDLSKLSDFIGINFLGMEAVKVKITTINEKINLVEFDGSLRLVRQYSDYSDETKDFIKERVLFLNNLNKKLNNVNFYAYFVIAPEYSEYIYPKNNVNKILPLLDTLNFPVEYFNLESMDDINKYFFTTDHHWNHIGYYKAYEKILELLRISKNEMLVPKGLFFFEDVEFWGSSSRTIAHSVDIEPDKMYKYIFDLSKSSFSVNNQLKEKYGNSEEYILNKDIVYEKGFDHYNNIYEPRNALNVFDTKQPEKNNIVVISDSFSNPVRELIAHHYNVSTFINLDSYIRKYKLMDIERIILDSKADDFLIFISIANMFPKGEIRFLE